LVASGIAQSTSLDFSVKMRLHNEKAQANNESLVASFYAPFAENANVRALPSDLAQ
jgi:hypothetical protein